MNKYGAKKTVVDGITFDSLREARRYGELKLLEKAGEIEDIKCHPTFSMRINGDLVAKYTADFSYWCSAECDRIVEDVKSPATAKDKYYRLKKRLMKALYDIEIREVY